MTPGRSGEGLCAPQHHSGSPGFPNPHHHSSNSVSFSLLRGAMKRTPTLIHTGTPSPPYLGGLGPARGSSPHPVKSSLDWLPPPHFPLLSDLLKSLPHCGNLLIQTGRASWKKRTPRAAAILGLC